MTNKLNDCITFPVKMVERLEHENKKLMNEVQMLRNRVKQLETVNRHLNGLSREREW